MAGTKEQIRDLTGEKFGRLKVMCPEVRDRKIIWRCECECGVNTRLAANKLLAGHTRSCGCLRREHAAQLHRTRVRFHQHHRFTLAEKETHRKWRSMLKRAPVCAAWFVFETFLKDMGTRPTVFHSPRRADLLEPFSPKNCEWMTLFQWRARQPAHVAADYLNKKTGIFDWDLWRAAGSPDFVSV